MEGPPVSVVIPVYNLAAYLEDCVRSVLEQTHRAVEVLIVDNGSTDDSVKIAERLAAQEPATIKLLHQPKPGAPAARNLGLGRATGSWIQFLDGDDLLLPEKIAHQLTFVTDEVAVVAGPVLEREEDGSETVRPLDPTTHEGLFYGGGRLGFTSSNLWSKRALEEIGGWNEALRSSQEYDLMFRLYERGYQIRRSSEPLTIRRVHAGQISQTPYGPRLYNYLKLRHRIFNHLRDQGLIRPESSHRFVAHYLSRYAKLRRFSPRLAARFRKVQLKEAMSWPEFANYPDLAKWRWQSDLQVVRGRIADLLSLRWKRYFGPLDPEV
ncbi:MAG: glycosyltransferase family A protein [Saprospiraceae bacterium]|nr:glycosyltransferase family A protein [Saprospiraceae bacterium]